MNTLEIISNVLCEKGCEMYEYIDDPSSNVPFITQSDEHFIKTLSSNQIVIEFSSFVEELPRHFLPMALVKLLKTRYTHIKSVMIDTEYGEDSDFALIVNTDVFYKKKKHSLRIAFCFGGDLNEEETTDDEKSFLKKHKKVFVVRGYVQISKSSVCKLEAVKS